MISVVELQGVSQGSIINQLRTALTAESVVLLKCVLLLGQLGAFALIKLLVFGGELCLIKMKCNLLEI